MVDEGDKSKIRQLRRKQSCNSLRLWQALGQSCLP